MELLDLVTEIEAYLDEKGLEASKISVDELLDLLNNDVLEEL